LPLQKLSLKFIKNFYKSSKGKIPIIGVGGIDSGQSAFEKIAAGATAVQLYTGMVYKGPGVFKDIKKELIEVLKKEKIKNIRQVIGINS
jgi:dihydroorotate dehydrogenase